MYQLSRNREISLYKISQIKLDSPQGLVMAIIFDPSKQWLFAYGNWKRVQYSGSEPFIEQPIVSVDNRFIACKKLGGWIPQPPERIENNYSQSIETGILTEDLKEYFRSLLRIEIGYFSSEEIGSDINKKHELIGEISGITNDSEYFEAFWKNGRRRGILRDVSTNHYSKSLLSRFAEMSFFEIEMRLKLVNPEPSQDEFEMLYQRNLQFLKNGEETRDFIEPVFLGLERLIDRDLRLVEIRKEKLGELKRLFDIRFSE